MTKKFLKITAKIVVGILMPAFLSMGLGQTTFAKSSSLIPVVFSIKNSADLAAVKMRYSIQTTKIFDKTYKTIISGSDFQRMQHDLSIQYVQQDPKIQALTFIAADPYFTSDPKNEDSQWYLPKIHVPDAWAYTQGSNNVIVAIIDTGIHASHIELNDGRVIEGYNTITNKSIPANTDSDDNGHGTAVAGIIGAIPNNSKGISGIDWNVKLMPVKALAADGTGELSAVSAGIIWATDHHANIINLSLGGGGFPADVTLSNAITYAYTHGVLVVAAAGNDLTDQGLNLNTNPVYPVCSDNGQNMVLGVAATDINDQKASFSNFGSNCIDISAPGERIITTAYLPSDPSDNILIYGSGTSVATPIVSGVAALIKASNPNFSNIEIRNLILSSADDISAMNQNTCFGGSCNGFLGAGRINALAAVGPKPLINASLVRDPLTGNIYFIKDKTKQLVSTAVFQFRGFDLNTVLTDTTGQLQKYQTAPPLLPPDGTLIKSVSSSLVYVVTQDVIRPLTYLVFQSRKFSFADIKTISDAEIATYAPGDWYWPPDGTLVLISGNPLVYVMESQVARPVSYFVFTQRHLSFGKVIRVNSDDFSHVPRSPDPYWEPPIEGTLVKSSSDPAVYVIENGTRELLSYEVFVKRNYSFANIRSLPQAEIDVIAPGTQAL